MLALFFQLKMMQSLQFIATLYDDLSEVTGEKTKPNYTIPPFRQALTTMLTATTQAVVAEIDKSPDPSEFASLKTSLTDPAVSAPVKLQIPPNQFEAVKQKTYVKLNKPYTAPPAANTAPATVPPALSSYRSKITELGLQKVDDLQQIDGGDLVIDSVIFATADTQEDGSMKVGFSNGDKPDFVNFYHIDYCWYVKPSDYKYYNITFANGSPNVQTNGSYYRQSDDRWLRDDDFQVQLWLSTGNINLENRWTDNLISLDDLKNANWWFISSVNNGTEPLNTPLTSNQASANEVSYSAMVDYTDAAGVVYGAQVSLLTNDSLSIHNSTNTQHFEGVDPIAIPYKLNDGISCEIRYTTSTGEEKTFSNMKFGLSSTGPSRNDDEHTEDYMFILAPNVIAVNNHSPNATGICEELRDATSVKIFFVNSNANTAPPPSANTPYAGSNYPSANVIDMYKVSTGATWDPVQPAVGVIDTSSLQLSSARVEYTQHVNNDGEMIVYGILPTGPDAPQNVEVRMNTYYYKESERQWYAPFLNTYDLTYVTSGSTFPIDVIFRDPNYEEKVGGGFNFTPENLDELRLTGVEPEVSLSTNGPGTLATAQVPYTVGPPTANSLPHDMHDMSLQIGIPGSASGQASSATMPLMNPLAAIAPQAANTITTFNIDGLVNVNDATPVEYNVQWQAEQLEIKVEQADDGSVKVTYHSPRNPGSAMFSAPVLGTFIHKGYNWYVDPTTYKSYEFISTNMEMSLYQCTYLPDGELDMTGEASVNWSYQIPRDGFMSMPLTEFNTGNFWFNGSSHNGTEPLNTPLTMKESFAAFPDNLSPLAIVDWKDLRDDRYPSYSDMANITYNPPKSNPFETLHIPTDSYIENYNLDVVYQEYGDGTRSVKFMVEDTVLNEYIVDQFTGKLRVKPEASGGSFARYQLLENDKMVNVKFKATNDQGEEITNATLIVRRPQGFPEDFAYFLHPAWQTSVSFNDDYPLHHNNNFNQSIPLLSIAEGSFYIDVNNRQMEVTRPLTGQRTAMDIGNQRLQPIEHLVIMQGEGYQGRYVKFYAAHPNANVEQIIVDDNAKRLLTEFEAQWPNTWTTDMPMFEHTLLSTPSTRTLNPYTTDTSSVKNITVISDVEQAFFYFNQTLTSTSGGMNDFYLITKNQIPTVPFYYAQYNETTAPDNPGATVHAESTRKGFIRYFLSQKNQLKIVLPANSTRVGPATLRLPENSISGYPNFF